MRSENDSKTAAHRVYILPTADGSRSKMGRTAATELNRVSAMKCLYPEIDLTRAAIIDVDSHQIEKALHIAFGTRRQPQPGRRDGFTEWFSGDIVDEAIEFLMTVADRRGVTYRVTRDIEALINEHRASNPQLGQRGARPSNAERAAAATRVEQRMGDLLTERALAVVDRLDERRFDSVVIHDDRAYLVRSVFREMEPECWCDDGSSKVSDWGRSLIALADADVHINGGSCRVRLLDFPCFVPLDACHGRECYLLAEWRPDDEESASPLLDAAAFAELWSALDGLPTIDSPHDPRSHGGPIASSTC